MSARAFAGIPRQFAKAMRFQRMNVPKMAPKMWKNEETIYQCFRELDRTSEFSSRNMRNLVNRMRSVEMKRIQIGALYTFSYVSKEFLELLMHFEDMLDDEKVDEEDHITTLTGRQSVTTLI
ncbi:hypothetical protein WA588_001015, partial [Blastocystis sp. NMH]